MRESVSTWGPQKDAIGEAKETLGCCEAPLQGLGLRSVLALLGLNSCITFLSLSFLIHRMEIRIPIFNGSHQK